MLNNLIFCLNATVPIFFLILLGMFLRRIQLMDDAFTARLNTLVFRVCLPALLFHDMYRTDYRTNWNTAYVVYCALATLASILICTGVSYLLKDRSVQGEFIQTSYRSSATILGIAVVQNLYHNVGMAPLMVIGAVPIYNIAAVIILEMYRPDRGKLDAMLLRKTLHGILTNPIILSILLGFAWSLLRLPGPLRHPAGNHRHGCFLSVGESPAVCRSRAGQYFYQAVRSVCPVPAIRSSSGVPERPVGGGAGDVRFVHHHQLLCHGKGHGTQRRPYHQHGDAHHPAFRLLSHLLAVHPEESRVDLSFEKSKN